MEHLKITREQERVLINHMGSLEKLIRMHRNEDENTALDDLTTDQLIDAYFGYYTIKETFKVGDWVVTKDGMVAEIIDVCMFHKDSVALYEVDGRHTFDTLRRATPEEIAEGKQRRWWAENGREVWELKQGDILKDKRNGFLYEYQRIGDAFLGKTIRLARFNEGRYDFWKNDVTKHFVVVVFAEDRKDVDHAE